jgi:ABC-2 type transport system ATP-binding protein
MPDYAIQFESVHKHYGKVHALSGLDLSVKKGEIFGFLGPNGAGKTTTIRCALDLIRPNSGSIRIFGLNPQQEPQKVKAMVGYLPGDLKIEGNFTGRDFITYIRKLRQKARPWDELQTLADRLSLDLDKKVKTLSHGNLQKVGFIQALCGYTPLIMLDEPTLGLDPLMSQEVLNIVREEKEQGTTVFFSSHILSEVQKVADRVGIIRKGTLVEIAQTDSLINRSFNRAIVQFSEPVSEEAFGSLPNVNVLSAAQNGLSYTLEIKGEMDSLIKRLAMYPVLDLEIHRPSLEEVFLEYYQDNGGEAS